MSATELEISEEKDLEYDYQRMHVFYQSNGMSVDNKDIIGDVSVTDGNILKMKNYFDDLIQNIEFNGNDKYKFVNWGNELFKRLFMFQSEFESNVLKYQRLSIQNDDILSKNTRFQNENNHLKSVNINYKEYINELEIRVNELNDDREMQANQIKIYEEYMEQTNIENDVLQRKSHEYELENDQLKQMVDVTMNELNDKRDELRKIENEYDTILIEKKRIQLQLERLQSKQNKQNRNDFNVTQKQHIESELDNMETIDNEDMYEDKVLNEDCIDVPDNIKYIRDATPQPTQTTFATNLADSFDDLNNGNDSNEYIMDVLSAIKQSVSVCFYI